MVELWTIIYHDIISISLKGVRIKICNIEVLVVLGL